MCDNFEELTEKIMELVMETRAGICPIWQCGGELEYIEDRTNWQEPDLKCKNCGAVWLLQGRLSEAEVMDFFRKKAKCYFDTHGYKINVEKIKDANYPMIDFIVVQNGVERSTHAVLWELMTFDLEMLEDWMKRTVDFLVKPR